MIPDYQAFMLPMLKYLVDGEEHSLRDMREHLASVCKLSESEKMELLPSGSDTTFNNRVRWARLYQEKAGLIETTKRGVYKITSRGLDVLAKNPPEINNKFLEQFPEYIEFRKPSGKEQLEAVQEEVEVAETQTPEESLERLHLEIKKNLAQEILAKIKECSPEFFERLVIELLVKMGYGGSRVDAARAIGRSGDGGIDGIIKEDRLGLDVIYI